MIRKNRQWIGVLDCNNFFVSCERVFRPDLWGRPVVVLSSNDGCVVARSQEVKDKGIPMGVPYFKVKDELSLMGAVVFSSHFALYRDLSRRVFALVREELAGEVAEEYSIDEAFFTFRGDAHAAYRKALTLRAAVAKRVGIPVSIGLACSKTQAKWGSEVAKKTSGVALLDAAWWKAHAGSVPLREVWGIGGRLAARYTALGLVTVADLLAAPLDTIAAQFGVGGTRLVAELAGEPAFPVSVHRRDPKSVVSSRSFRGPTQEKAVLADALAYHLRHVTAELRAQELLAQRLRIFIRPSRHGDFMLRGGVREVLLATPSADTFLFLAHVRTLLDELFEPAVPYQKAGIELSQIVPSGAANRPLFPTDDGRESGMLLGTLDRLNGRYGREVVVLGSRLQSQRWSVRADRRSPAYTTRWSEVPTVYAIV